MTLLLTGILAVVLMAGRVSSSDGCQEDDRPVPCYECSTVRGEDFCGDPFNLTDIMEPTTCDGSCVKWIRYDIDDQNTRHVIRTCSARLKIRMHIHQVCMKESYPNKGQLCFCRGMKACNKGTRTSCYDATLFLMVALFALSLQRHLACMSCIMSPMCHLVLTILHLVLYSGANIRSHIGSLGSVLLTNRGYFRQNKLLRILNLPNVHR